MRIAENQWTEFHHRDKSREVHNFSVRIATIDNSREIEKLCTLVNFCPEALFQRLFSVTERSGFLNEVEMSENTDDFRKSMGLQDIQKLEGFLPVRLLV